MLAVSVGAVALATAVPNWPVPWRLMIMLVLLAAGLVFLIQALRRPNGSATVFALRGGAFAASARIQSARA